MNRHTALILLMTSATLLIIASTVSYHKAVNDLQTCVGMLSEQEP